MDQDAFRLDQKGSPVFANPKTAARKARAWAIGFNWYLNCNVKFVMDYEQTDFQGGGDGGDREDERFLLSRFQIAF